MPACEVKAGAEAACWWDLHYGPEAGNLWLLFASTQSDIPLFFWSERLSTAERTVHISTRNNSKAPQKPKSRVKCVLALIDLALFIAQSGTAGPYQEQFADLCLY